MQDLRCFSHTIFFATANILISKEKSANNSFFIWIFTVLFVPLHRFLETCEGIHLIYIMKKLIVVTGPTAVGKTALCMELATHLATPIINADSRQLYRDLKIGTAAPTDEQLRQVKHFFVGTLGLNDYYSASIYEEQAIAIIRQQHLTSDYALLTGGSMMYIDAVCNGIDDIPTVDDATRTLMKQRLQSEGLEALCDELRQLDPEHWTIVDRHNPRRVVHALEICHATGRTYTSFRQGRRKQRPFTIVKIGLTLPREQLYERINKRVDLMMNQGLLDEARRLLPYRHLNALNTVGYKEMFAHLDGQFTLQEAVERMKGNTRRYARKQLTWFKRDNEIKWFAPDEQQNILKHIQAAD